MLNKDSARATMLRVSEFITMRWKPTTLMLIFGAVAVLAIPNEALFAQNSSGGSAANEANRSLRIRVPWDLLFRVEDLSPTDIVARRAGKVKVEFTVGPSGRVTECQPVIKSEFWQIDDLTCRLLRRRAIFFPATDSSGNPVSAKSHKTVTWESPDFGGAELLRLYSERALQGDADAMVALGMLYERGSVGPRDYATAFMWYRKGADGGNAEGMYRLGELHLRGLGVAKSEEAATALFLLSEQKGNLDAKRTLFALSPEGKRQALAQDQARLAQDQARQRALRQQAAERKAAAEFSVRTKNCVPLNSGRCVSLDSFVYIQMRENGQPWEKRAFSTKDSCETSAYDGHFCVGMIAREAWRQNYRFES